MRIAVVAVTALLMTAPVFSQDRPQRREGRAARQQRLTPEQRQAMRQGLRLRRPLRLRHALKRMDQDGNGAISRQEWRRTAEMFDRLDVNKDGQLTRDEIRGARTAAPRRIR